MSSIISKLTKFLDDFFPGRQVELNLRGKLNTLVVQNSHLYKKITGSFVQNSGNRKNAYK